MNQHVAILEPSLNRIPTECVEQVLPLVIGAITSVAERSRGKMTVESMVDRFIRGEWDLWLVWDNAALAVGATAVCIDDDHQKACEIAFWTGEHSIRWLHLIDDLEAWAKSQGCRRLRGAMRKGWAKRLPDFRMTHVFMEKDIG